MPERMFTQIGTRQLALSHLEKRLWPEFTKAEAIDYYLRVSEVLIRHVRRRPASFLRCPAGPEGPRFFTHSADTLHLPGWIATAAKGGRTHIAIDNPETLIAAVNAYCLEVHTPQWTSETGPDMHDRLILDLDPGEGADLATCCRVALLLRGELEADGLTVVPATSGGKGLHLLVPLAPPWLAEDATGYAKTIARRLRACF
jgi:bifunctional non-homologous end joining protein LigD